MFKYLGALHKKLTINAQNGIYNLCGMNQRKITHCMENSMCVFRVVLVCKDSYICAMCMIYLQIVYVLCTVMCADTEWCVYVPKNGLCMDKFFFFNICRGSCLF